MPASKRKTRGSIGSHHNEEKSPSRKNRSSVTADDSEDDEAKPIIFSQRNNFELSQSIPSVKESERIKLSKQNETVMHQATTDLSRILLFKALAGEPIDRNKCIQEALKDVKEYKVSNAIFERAAKRLVDVFGFDICGIPDFMKDALKSKSKFSTRYYMVNKIIDDDGKHSRSLHDNGGSMENGLLMVVLAFAYCKGISSKERGDRTIRWIKDDQLYRLLNMVDPNIPGDPPSGENSRHSRHQKKELDVDSLLEKFVHMDYLLKEKVVVENQEDAKGLMYAMGPRAALEIGRRQLVHFCAEILDENVDEAMLAEIDNGEGDE